MTKAIQTKSATNLAALEKAIMEWDFAGLNEMQRLSFLKNICKESGLKMNLQPFTYIRFQGKLVPYLNGGGAAQLRSINKLSAQVIKREIDKENSILMITVRVFGKDRSDEAMAAVYIGGLRGVELANAHLKCETKAKRRATLSITGMLQYDTPAGEEEPIKQSETEIRIEEVTAKAETSESPAFQSILAEAETKALIETPEKPEDPDKGYVMKAGKNQGKFLKDMPKSKLEKWMKWYQLQIEKGVPLHADVQDDAFHISAFLLEPTQEETIRG